MIKCIDGRRVWRFVRIKSWNVQSMVFWKYGKHGVNSRIIDVNDSVNEISNLLLPWWINWVKELAMQFPTSLLGWHFGKLAAANKTILLFLLRVHNLASFFCVLRYGTDGLKHSERSEMNPGSIFVHDGYTWTENCKEKSFDLKLRSLEPSFPKPTHCMDWQTIEINCKCFLGFSRKSSTLCNNDHNKINNKQRNTKNFHFFLKKSKRICFHLMLIAWHGQIE